MHAFDVLGDPVRRRILELLAGEARAAGNIAEVVSAEFGISHAAVSQHLKVLRESGFAAVEVDGSKRLYSLDTAPMQEVDQWLNRFRSFWEPALMALDTEIARGKKTRRDREG